MQESLLTKILSLSVFIKAVFYKSGALSFLSIPITIGVVGMIKTLVRGVDEYYLILPLLTTALGVAIYFLFFLFDFVWGLIAAKHDFYKKIEEDQKKGIETIITSKKGFKIMPDWVESNKLYSSLGKIGGVLLINMMMLPLVVFITIVGFQKIATALLIVSVMLNVLAISYEVHSIGENIQRRTDKKPPYLAFFDKVTTLIEGKIIKKIDDNT